MNITLCFLHLLLSFSFPIPDLHPTFSCPIPACLQPYSWIFYCYCTCLPQPIMVPYHAMSWDNWLANWHIRHTYPIPSTQTNTRISPASSWPFRQSKEPPNHLPPKISVIPQNIPQRSDCTGVERNSKNLTGIASWRPFRLFGQRMSSRQQDVETAVERP